MRALTFKNCILTILQLPVLSVRLLVACVDLLLVKCLALTNNSLSSPFTATSHKKTEAQPDVISTEQAEKIKAVLELLNSSDYFTVRRFRITLERTIEGITAIQTNPDRHDYAVLIPNKTENIRRIENVFCWMDSITLDRVLRNAETILSAKS